MAYNNPMLPNQPGPGLGRPGGLQIGRQTMPGPGPLNRPAGLPGQGPQFMPPGVANMPDAARPERFAGLPPRPPGGIGGGQSPQLGGGMPPGPPPGAAGAHPWLDAHPMIQQRLQAARANGEHPLMQHPGLLQMLMAQRGSGGGPP